MSIVLTHGKFGESTIRLVRLVGQGDRQELRDLTVQLLLKGDFERGFTAGEALPLENEQAIADRVYALAHEHCGDQIEPFALLLSQHVLRFFPRVNEAEVEIGERVWSRVLVSGRPHDRAFSASGEQRLTRVTRTAETVYVEAGFSALPILRIMPRADAQQPSLFSGYLTARWRYGWTDVPFGLHWQQVRQVVLETFANHAAGPTQQLLHDMAQAALDQTPAIIEMRFVLNVMRHRPADLSRSGVENDGNLLIPDTAPVGVIETTVVRES
jgi:urate oxidase